jgi:cytochrome c biogenesis protein CcmG, thiol:disulfide interchange protein DsbE
LLVTGLIAVCAGLTAILVVGLANQDDVAAPGPQITGPSLQVAPFEPFSAPAVEGEVVTGDGAGSRLALADLRGRPVVLNFWASWCEPCRREGPDLVAFSKSHPEVAMMGINVSDGEASAVPFADQLGFVWPSIADRDQRLVREFRLIGLPATFVVDADGRVVYRKLGEVTAAELEAAVGNLA